MSDIIRTVRRFGVYYTRAEPFRESDPKGWEAREKAGERVKASLRVPRPAPTALALPCEPVGGGKVVLIRKVRK